uniref:Uncharacterized protein n=1 Tax=Bombyx mori TaxID=7091 RepID=A0A8R2M814_BOMMO|nr:uncharacterized protein LOC101744332 isoform X2 [Bombyx mori]
MNKMQDRDERHIIACHTTDFECFKRQYKSLKDNALLRPGLLPWSMLSNMNLGIETYTPYVYQYADTGTCIQISGLEQSELVAISMNSQYKEYSIMLEMPFKIQQILNGTEHCNEPDRAFQKIGLHKGPLRRFTGNATAQVTYPYRLDQSEGETYLRLEEENLDMILDLPDLSHFDKTDPTQARLSEWSAWAYRVVQHADIAKHVLMSHTTLLRDLIGRFPLKKFLLLYPEEEYSNIQFSFSENTVL